MVLFVRRTIALTLLFMAVPFVVVGVGLCLLAREFASD
jgi:hypothetical protein